MQKGVDGVASCHKHAEVYGIVSTVPRRCGCPELCYAVETKASNR